VADDLIKIKSKTSKKKGRSGKAAKQAEETAAAPTPSSSGAGSNDGHERALECADSVVTFLRGLEITKLSKNQRNDWKKVVEEMLTWLRKLGVTVSIK
jgi:hypothetical protein